MAIPIRSQPLTLNSHYHFEKIMQTLHFQSVVMARLAP